MSKLNKPCWEWYGKVRENGYARMTHKQQSYYAHRFVWEAFNGPIPDELEVCHTCDNRSCCNPAHLFLGTRKDNMQDALVKGRLQRGENRYNAVLNEGKVRAIRRRVAAGETYVQLAREYGTTPSTVGNAARGKTWRHIL